MRLRDIHPEDFLRAGAVFGEVAEQVGDTITQARTCAHVTWVGRPNQAYQQRLSELCGDLGKIQRTYDDACNALIAYSGALSDVRDLALQSDLLAAQAGDLIGDRERASWRDSLDPSLLSRTPQEQALLDRARLLGQEAQELEQLASRRVAATLRQLADDAPHLSGWTSFDRGIARAAQGAEEPAIGMAHLAGDAISSLPGVTDEKSRTEARKALWSEGLAMVQPWLGVEQLLDELAQGQYAHAAGAAAGAFVFRHVGGRKVELFGAHDDLPVGVLGALRNVPKSEKLELVEAWVREHAQKDFLDQMIRFRKAKPPTVDELLTNGVDLVQQEALGGHTVYKHLGRDLDFLARRQKAEVGKKGALLPFSSFASQEEAELVIDRALRQPENAAALRAYAAGSSREPMRVEGLAEGSGVLVGPSGREVRVAFAIIEFRKDAKGTVILNSAFLKGVP